MNFLEVIFLSIVQGIAEFLPISSSGHLAVLGTLFHYNPESNLQLGIVLHAGTLLAIVIFYFGELLKFFRQDHLKLMGMVILGSVPAGIFGIALKKSGLEERLFGDILLVGICFLATGWILRFIRPRAEGGTKDAKDITVRQALLTGLVQAVAILPGISRSGSTIAAAIRCGMAPAAAAEFSFLLAIPAIGGAAFLEVLPIFKDEAPSGADQWPMLLTGFLLSAAVGYFALKFLIRLISKGDFRIFSYYLWTVGTLVILWRLWMFF